MTARQPLLTRFLSFVLRLVVGGIFVYAGVVKILDPAGFATDVANYRVLPLVLVNFVAITLPWVETVVGILMVMGFWLPGSALVITGLMGVFLAAIGQALARGLDIRCGCFGTIEGGKMDALTLVRDIALFVCAAWLYWRASAVESNRGKKNASANGGN
jgi:uncharacterized membrane protein YphA (DoxX/SURF4 family)